MAQNDTNQNQDTTNQISTNETNETGTTVALGGSSMHVPQKPTSALSVEPVVGVESTPVAVVPTAPPPSMANPPLTAPTEISMEDEIAQNEKAIKDFGNERLRIEEESKKLFSERKVLEEKLAPILLEEKLSIERIAILEKKKQHAADQSQSRIAETERWAEEDHRREIEHRKWDVGAELEIVTQKIKEVEHVFKSLLANEENSKVAIMQLHTKVAQRDLGVELQKVTGEKGATETQLAQFSHERERLETLLRETAMREEEAVIAEHAVDRKIESARGLYEEQVLAGERHKLEDERKDAEQKRWAAEDAMLPVAHSVLESQKHLEEIKKRESEILAKLDALAKS